MIANMDRVRTRLYHLACHVGPAPRSKFLWSPHSLCAELCSAGVGEAILRRDNRVHFARQGSDSLGQFMQQVEVKQVVNSNDKDEDGLVSTLGTGSVAGHRSSPAGDTTREISNDSLGPSFAAVAPLFGQPVPRNSIDNHTGSPSASSPRSGSGPQVRSTLERQKNGIDRCSIDNSDTTKELPAASGQTQADCFEFEWFPRMDVVESGTAYVITIELPGVSADGIHVEVVRGSLIVTGSRATDWWKANGNGSNGGSTVYHRRELAQGPYRAVWRLPKKGDINGITAEFIDGFLRVLVPKIKMMTYL